MQKTLLIIGILVVTLFSTACVNKFAVQELNNNAKALIAEGRVDDAIARLESSIDLDEKVFETHYNLAVVYIQAKKYDKAIKSLEKTIELNPDFADAYYSLAVAEENLAKDIISGDVEVNDDGTIEKADDDDKEEETKLSDIAKSTLTNVINNSISDYKLYLEKSPSAQDRDEVDASIKALEELLKTHAN